MPEFLYSGLYNSKGHMMGITGRGNKGWAPLQKGLREHLFCESCEQHFNEQYEKPFHKLWVQNCPLPESWQTEQIRWIKVDYAPFKLFHLSVLFRAGVSSLPTFAEVSLGPHEERLRQMLLAQDAGPVELYPIFGYAVVHHKTARAVQMVSGVYSSKVGGRRCYSAMYGGVQWSIGVASDTNRELQHVALRVDGTMPFTFVLSNEVAVVQAAGTALRSAGT